VPRTIRRLATDHAQLHKAGLPPNFFFPPGSDSLSDLTTLSVYLAGPAASPYATGVFRLELRMDSAYPQTPPSAHFRTKIFHPNVDGATGAVCVDTLKRDWSPDLTLRHVLLTISCLLLCPNPASALNAEAGALLVEDQAAFERRAAMWARLHAAAPPALAAAADEARRRIVEDAPAAGTAAPRGTKRRDATPVTALGQQQQQQAPLTPRTVLSPQTRRPAGLGALETPTQAPRRTARARLAKPPPSPSFRRPPPPLSAARTTFPPVTTPSARQTPAALPTATEPPRKRRRTMSSPYDAASAARTPALQTFPATPLTATKFAVAAVAPHLPRCQHPLLFRRAGRDPASDPFGDAFNMPWLEWEKYLPGARDGPGILAGGVDVEMGGAAGMVFGPRRGILRL
jgi:ubiquitin-protein ligase